MATAHLGSGGARPRKRALDVAAARVGELQPGRGVVARARWASQRARIEGPGPDGPARPRAEDELRRAAAHVADGVGRAGGGGRRDGTAGEGIAGPPLPAGAPARGRSRARCARSSRVRALAARGGTDLAIPAPGSSGPGVSLAHPPGPEQLAVRMTPVALDVARPVRAAVLSSLRGFTAPSFTAATSRRTVFEPMSITPTRIRYPHL